MTLKLALMFLLSVVAEGRKKLEALNCLHPNLCKRNRINTHFETLHGIISLNSQSTFNGLIPKRHHKFSLQKSCWWNLGPLSLSTCWDEKTTPNFFGWALSLWSWQRRSEERYQRCCEKVAKTPSIVIVGTFQVLILYIIYMDEPFTGLVTTNPLFSLAC